MAAFRKSLTVGLGVPGLLMAAEKEDWTGWQWEGSFQIAREGLVRLEIPPLLLDKTRRDFGDLRIVNPAGAETPWLLGVNGMDGAVIRDAPGFKVTLKEVETLIETTHTVEGAEAERVDGLQLVSPAKDFLKSVTIEGRGGDVGWQGLATQEPVFRQAGGVERMRIGIPAGPWEEFRITVDDRRSEPVVFTGVRLEIATTEPETTSAPVRLGGRSDENGETRITLDLGARNQHVAALRFDIPDALFSRAVSLAYRVPTPEGEDRMETFAEGVLFRIGDGTGKTAEQSAIDVHRRIPSREVIATFRNGDSPPLDLAKAMLALYPTRAVFHAAAAGTWRVVTDNPGAKSPDYDLKDLAPQLAGSQGTMIHPRQIRRNPDFVSPEPLSELDVSGAKIDLAEWARQRPLDARPGVLRIELDEQVLAVCRTDLGDLRLVQQGRQIPYLVARETQRREVKTRLKLLPANPQRPNHGRWEVQLPVDGLPASALTGTSPAPLFTRRFVASVERKDALGNRWNQDIGAAEWVRTRDKDSPLWISFQGERLPASLILETDHGDNPPILLEEVTVLYDAPILVAKVTESAPVFLCYGNPKAEPPRYDLELVRAELLAATPQPAALAEEEILKPNPNGPDSDAGSPWLWLSLGAVVVALLTIVAKLLPRNS